LRRPWKLAPIKIILTLQPFFNFLYFFSQFFLWFSFFVFIIVSLRFWKARKFIFTQLFEKRFQKGAFAFSTDLCRLRDP
jgi:hypothetical protein